MTDEPQSFTDQFLSQFEGLQRIVMEGVENLGNVTLGLGEAAVNGIGAIAGLIGLGGAASGLASAGSGNKSNAPGISPPAPVPNMRTTPEIASPSIEMQIAQATEKIKGLPPEVLALVLPAVNSVRDSTPNYYTEGRMAHAGIEAHSSNPLTTGAALSQAAKGLG